MSEQLRNARARVDGPAIVALNYTTHFREWWRETRGTTADLTHPGTKAFDVAYELCGRAQRFLLPARGWVLDPQGVMDAKYAPLLHLPYSVTAFEFSAGGRGVQEREDLSSKRISLCFDGQVAKEMGICTLAEDEWMSISICSFDHFAIWGVIPVCTVISRSRTRTVTEADVSAVTKGNEFLDHFVPDRSAPRIGSEQLDIRFGRLPGAETFPVESAYVDTRDEWIAAVQACAALNCSNVTVRSIPASEPLNRKRVASGNEPFSGYHVLELFDSGTDKTGATGGAGGAHASPRQHLRRGHIRRLSENRSIWVNSCVIGDPNRGVIMKDYRLAQ